MSRIQVLTSFVGVHRWEHAPEEVAFLRNEHRHVFKVTASCVVDHSDRELEFFMVRQQIDSYIANLFPPYHRCMQGILQAGTMSCEVMSYLIGAHLAHVYSRLFTITVREDDENAGIVEHGC